MFPFILASEQIAFSSSAKTIDWYATVDQGSDMAQNTRRRQSLDQ